jgi:hypothetical protein
MIIVIETNLYVAESSGAIVPEVLSGLGDSLAVEANDNATEFLIAMGDIEVDLTHQLARSHIPTQKLSLPCA